MSENTLMVCGNVCTSPRHLVTDEGLKITSFRIASTARRFDRESRQWIDGETTFLTVTCFRALASNVATSVEKGQRVMVLGKLRIRPWKKGERSGTNVEVEAQSVGHDLAWGTSAFTRISRVERLDPPGRAEADELAAEQLAAEAAADDEQFGGFGAEPFQPAGLEPADLPAGYDADHREPQLSGAPGS